MNRVLGMVPGEALAPSRVAQRGIEMARARGIRVGKLRLVTVWPFPEQLIRTLAKRVTAFVVPELNLGERFCHHEAELRS